MGAAATALSVRRATRALARARARLPSKDVAAEHIVEGVGLVVGSAAMREIAMREMTCAVARSRQVRSQTGTASVTRSNIASSAIGDHVTDRERAWMEYTNTEVALVCEQLGMARQIRRRWAVRHLPVASSGLEDYEWKIIPGQVGELPAESHPSYRFEGRYYVLSVDIRARRFSFLHDAFRAGRVSPMWEVEEVSQISDAGGMSENPTTGHETSVCPPHGWLSSHLARLLAVHGPNVFSNT